MPAKNALKTYIQDGYYHIYNRGVEKRTIFQEERDYKIFLSYLRFYLLPQALQGESLKSGSIFYPSRQPNNYASSLTLHAYALKPNHFHLLVHQTEPTTINHFMRSLGTKYVRAFNTHYQRVGPLFEGPYKAVYLPTMSDVLFVSGYIHRNFYELAQATSRTLLEVSEYSSYRNYLGITNQEWVKPQPILDYFCKRHTTTTYQDYVEKIDDETSRTLLEV